MTAVAPRRWLRFSLRSLFIALTILACWLGYQLNWIRQRREFYAKNEADMLQHCGSTMIGVQYGKAPGLLWLFGESAKPLIVLHVEGNSPEALTPADLERIRQARLLFPETRGDFGIAHDKKWAAMAPPFKPRVKQ
jgi:hypothetical protein